VVAVVEEYLVVKKMVYQVVQVVEQDMDLIVEEQVILLPLVLLKDLMEETLPELQDLLVVVVELVQRVEMVIRVQVIQQELILADQVEQVLQQKLQQVQ
tara:strand:- start:215 stop:511 length:297 start_codon:yes stop_codon:yes gene_type:complete